jgi:hypothetical protein
LKQDLKSLYPLILTVVVISTGVVVLLSLVIESHVLDSLRALFVEWTVIVIAFALLIGVFNVVRVHARRIQAGKGALYSVVLVVAFLIVFIPGILSPERVPAGLQPWVGPTGGIVDFAYRYVQRPLQATLFSLMGFFVFTAAWRVFRVRSAASFVMCIAALVVLLGSIRLGIGGGWAVPAEASSWVLNVPVKAGARGLLLGIALGTVVTGLRLLLGIDRSYHE